MSKHQIQTDGMELLPRYRDYPTADSVILAFRSGKDFEGDFSIGFQTCSIRDFAPGLQVVLYYNGKSKSTTITV